MATTSLVRRVLHLEDAGGDGECPRCSGMVAIFMNSAFSGAHKNGEPMTEEEWDDFEAEEDEAGRCPACGEKALEIRVGWPEQV